MTQASKGARRVAESIRHLAGQQASAFSHRLGTQPGQLPFKNVHETRTCIKRLRALLRLVREAIGGDFYRRQNHALRAVAHSLSPVRDAEVQLNTLRRIRERHPRWISRAEFSRLEQSLSASHQKSLEAILKPQAEWLPKLHGALAEIMSRPLAKFKKRDLCRNLKKTARRFARAGKKAVRHPDTENLHVWRKRTKELFFQLSLLEQLGKKSPGKLVAGLKKLGRHLGDEHDFVMLETGLQKPDLKDLEKARKHLRSQRKKFQKSAFQTGRKLRVRG